VATKVAIIGPVSFRRTLVGFLRGKGVNVGEANSVYFGSCVEASPLVTRFDPVQCSLVIMGGVKRGSDTFIEAMRRRQVGVVVWRSERDSKIPYRKQPGTKLYFHPQDDTVFIDVVSAAISK
jgi:hypothetical protein